MSEQELSNQLQASRQQIEFLKEQIQKLETQFEKLSDREHDLSCKVAGHDATNRCNEEWLQRLHDEVRTLSK